MRDAADAHAHLADACVGRPQAQDVVPGGQVGAAEAAAALLRAADAAQLPAREARRVAVEAGAATGNHEALVEGGGWRGEG